MVVPKSGYHFPIGCRERIQGMVDADTFVEFDAQVRSADPLKFVDSAAYPDRIKRYEKDSGLAEAVLCGTAKIDGIPVSLAVMDFRFCGGAMGAAVGEKITRAIERALKLKTPCIVVSSSGGARMQEGIFSLMQMAKTSAALGRLAEARLLFISILTYPTTGGVTASFATLGDVILAEPGALIGFAGARVIKETTKQTLPAGFPDRRVPAQARSDRPDCQPPGDEGSPDQPAAGLPFPPLPRAQGADGGAVSCGGGGRPQRKFSTDCTGWIEQEKRPALAASGPCVSPPVIRESVVKELPTTPRSPNTSTRSRRAGPKFGIDRMRRLAAALGHPERSYPVIHVAGTNGKGSVAAMLDAILHAAGWRTGLYTSPHSGEARRTRAGGPPPAHRGRNRRLHQRAPPAGRPGRRDAADEHATFFEFMTAMAFLQFQRRRVDLAIVEVGMGGRLDATNVVQPEVTVITSIGLDHIAELGGTIAQIAREKAGIIKPGRPVVIGRCRPRRRGRPREVAAEPAPGARGARGLRRGY
jgi:acetyl-CoA carboxylase carboxyl transferase subunit beta